MMKAFMEKMKGNPIRLKQMRNGAVAMVALVMIFLMFSWLTETPRKATKKEEIPELTGITGQEFTEKNTESALTSQQSELERVEDKLDKVTKALEALQSHQESVSDDLKALAVNQDGLMHRTDALESEPSALPDSDAEKKEVEAMTRGLGAGIQPYPPNALAMAQTNQVGRMVHISLVDTTIEKNNDTYVPAATYAKAVIIGGADANASVTGTQDQKPMVFKIMDEGVIPGGGHSHLKNCVVIAGTWGDISNERAEVRLNHITCKNYRGTNSTVEEDIEGWVWYHGKEGIKGIPLMRDDKILTWAGLSGMLAGFANAAQYAQTDQSVSELGAVNTVSPSNIATYGALGGASTAMNNLSNYYIKRAEQYHPVIQVGAANEVTLVFKKGFFIVPHDKKSGVDAPIQKPTSVKIPPEILRQMQHNTSGLGQTVGVTS